MAAPAYKSTSFVARTIRHPYLSHAEKVRSPNQIRNVPVGTGAEPGQSESGTPA
jgi:hypothetical protein